MTMKCKDVIVVRTLDEYSHTHITPYYALALWYWTLSNAAICLSVYVPFLQINNLVALL